MARGSSRGGGQRRAASSWIWQTANTAVSALAAGGLTAFEMFVLPDDATDETLFRTVADVYFGKTAVQATAAVPLTCGFIVSQQRALAAGTASLPRPIEEAEQEWIFRSQVVLSRSTAADTLVRSELRHLDIKSRRRVNASENLVLVFENPSAVAVEVAAIISVLSKSSGT